MKIFFFFLTIFSLFLINEAVAKHRKKPVKIDPAISAEYFLQINLSQSECEKIIGGECFRRDHMRDEPYYHQTRITIFRDKIFAEQFLQNTERSTDRLFLAIKNNSYKLTDNSGNLISFSVQDGAVSKLSLLKGNLENEKKAESRCVISEAIYGFYQAHDKSQTVERSRFFKDEYNFNGLQEFIFFVEKSNQAEVMVIIKNSPNSPTAIKDLRLCKMPNSENFFVKHVTEEECKTSLEQNAAECSKYSVCEDYLVMKNCDVMLLRDPMN